MWSRIVRGVTDATVTARRDIADRVLAELIDVLGLMQVRVTGSVTRHEGPTWS